MRSASTCESYKAGRSQGRQMQKIYVAFLPVAGVDIKMWALLGSQGAN